MKKIRLLNIFIICLVFFFTGCGDKEPPTYLEVNEYLSDYYGDTYEFISKKEMEDELERIDITQYRFRSKFGFEFEAKGFRTYQAAIGGYHKSYDTNYELKISPLIEEDAKYLANKIGLSNIDITEGLDVEIILDEYDDIELVNELCYELYDLYEGKYELEDDFIKLVDITLEKDDIKIWCSKNLKDMNETNKNENLEYLKETYLIQVKK